MPDSDRLQESEGYFPQTDDFTGLTVLFQNIPLHMQHEAASNNRHLVCLCRRHVQSIVSPPLSFHLEQPGAMVSDLQNIKQNITHYILGTAI